MVDVADLVDERHTCGHAGVAHHIPSFQVGGIRNDLRKVFHNDADAVASKGFAQRIHIVNAGQAAHTMRESIKTGVCCHILGQFNSQHGIHDGEIRKSSSITHRKLSICIHEMNHAGESHFAARAGGSGTQDEKCAGVPARERAGVQIVGNGFAGVVDDDVDALGSIHSLATANGNDSIRLEITGDLRTVVNSKVRCILNQVTVNDALDSRFLQLALQIGGKPVVHEVGGHHQHRSFEVPIVQFIGECVDLVLTENDCGLGKNVKIHIRQSPFYFF